MYSDFIFLIILYSSVDYFRSYYMFIKFIPHSVDLIFSSEIWTYNYEKKTIIKLMKEKNAIYIKFSRYTYICIKF